MMKKEEYDDGKENDNADYASSDGTFADPPIRLCSSCPRYALVERTSGTVSIGRWLRYKTSIMRPRRTC